MNIGHFDFFNQYVIAMVNHPAKTSFFLSTPYEINEYKSPFSDSLELLYKLTFGLAKCNYNVLFLDESSERLVSICNDKIFLLDLT